MKLSLAYNFRAMVFITQNFNHLHVAHSFDELLINFSRSFLLKFDFSLHKIIEINAVQK